MSASFRQAEGRPGRMSRPGRLLVWLTPVLTASLALMITAAALGSGVDMRVSTDSSSNEADNFSQQAAISADGRYVTFASLASNLAAGDTNLKTDVFLKDTLTGATTRVSTDAAGSQGNGDCFESSISADGRYVAFESLATNLVAGDTNNRKDIFVKDTLTGATTRVSTSTAGSQGNDISQLPVISADGRYVAFQSTASNLVAGDTNLVDDIFVKDTQTGATTRVSTDSAGAQGNAWSYSYLAVSANGRYVVFGSDATNLVAGDSNGAGDVFLKDTQTGATTRVSTDSAGSQGNANSGGSAISADGRYVAFQSTAANLVTGDNNAKTDVFLKDTLTGATTRVSTASGGAEGNNWSQQPAISADGRYVAFVSSADNLVAGDTNLVYDIFLKDVQTGETVRVSATPAGTGGDWNSFDAAISADGGHVAFSSDATNLVAGDVNDASDVYLATVGCTPAEPPLVLESTGVYWGSMADYAAGLLSTDYRVKNNGAAPAYTVQVTGATGTNGVFCTVCTASPGDLAAGGEQPFTLKFIIPTGVTSFSTTVSASAQDGCGTVYTYP